MSTQTRKIQQRSTLGEIARDAGVSISTVSTVLAGKAKERRVSDQVVARVQDAATKLDYAPNLLVRSLQKGQTHVLSFFNGFRNQNRTDLYLGWLTTMLEQSAGRRGYDLLVTCDFSRSVEETYRYLNGGRSDGMIFFAPQANDPLLPFLRKSRLPVVLMSREDPEHLLSSVNADIEDGIRQVAENLLALGHRRIAAITNETARKDLAGRRIAYLQDFLSRQGCAIPERWIVPAWDDAPSEAADALRFLMAEPDPPTALFCWHDRIGYKILEQCDAQGVRVPEQLTVIGYDGLQWPSSSKHQLASAAVEMDDLAETTIDLLIRLMHDQEAAPVERLIPVRLTPGTTLSSPRRYA